MERGKRKHTSSFQEEMNLRGIKMRVAGNIAFRGRFQSWLRDEYSRLTGLAKEKIVQPAPNVRAAELVFEWVDAGKKTLKDAVNASIATSAWPVEMTKIGRYSKRTHSYATIFLGFLKLRISKNCRQQSQLRDYQKFSALGVD